MTKVFIAGSISINRLHPKVEERIANVVASGLNVVVGDADGADTAIQECLHSHRAANVTVYCTGDSPRNNIGDWPVHRVNSSARAGSRAYYTAKDVEMARNSDYGLMIWDCKSTGTLSNVLELLDRKKKTIVFLNKHQEFVTVRDVAGLEQLLSFMSPHARSQAEKKISLSSRMSDLSQPQFALPMVGGNIPLATRPAENKEEVPEDSAYSTESMKLRSELMSALKHHIATAHLSQSQAANVFGVTQPRISDLTRGKVGLFGLDTLVNMAATAGLRVEMHVRASSD
ncbi:helix-turn-helix domain-containing protein [Luteimonas sp. A478]